MTSRRALLLSALITLGCAPTDRGAPAGGDAIPHLRPKGTTSQLFVDGAPFLILGNELGNSAGADLASLEEYWALFDSLNLNTLLAPVSWELIEPEEGRFDFASVDGLLRQARTHRTKLVLLWFGSWKNSMSSYVPAWVKRDQARFPRAERAPGTGMEILSAHSAANREADARAFAALMAHLREVDARSHTVIMVQVENEVGMIPNARDRSAIADSLFAGPVPQALLAYLAAHRDSLVAAMRERWQRAGARTSGTWRQVFGAGVATDELFTAWYHAVYTGAVAAAGKHEYPLPLFANAALIRPGRQPGEYPSGGPLPHLIDVWRAAAPSLDFLAPDIYFPNFVEWAGAYAVPGNMLFVPEVGRAPAALAGNALYAVGALNASGFSPFAIERFRGDDPLARAYALLEQLAPLIHEHAGANTMTGVRAPVSFEGVVNETPAEVRLGGFTLRVAFRDPFGRADQSVESHGGLIIQLGPEEYLIAGTGLTVTFAADSGSVGIESAWQGTYERGRWMPRRLLNGDETHQGRHMRIPDGQFGIQRVRLYRYR